MNKELTIEALNIILGDDYERGEYSLKDELTRFYSETNEDLEYVEYELCGPPGEEDGYFSKFIAYSATYVLFLVNGGFNDDMLIWIPRNYKKD